MPFRLIPKVFNAVGHLKECRRVATRYEKLAVRYGARAKAAGMKATAHVSRNKAAHIAGGIGAAGVAGLVFVLPYLAITIVIVYNTESL